MHDFLGADDEALNWHENTLALAESRGDPYLQACAQSSLGICLFRKGDLDRAEQLTRKALHGFSVLGEPWISTHCLEGLAWIAGSRHDFRRAAVLMAAAVALTSAAGTALFPLPDQARWHDDCERRARAALDADEFESAWVQGTAMTLDQAVAFAMADAVV